jgi:hypothetical protein
MELLATIHLDRPMTLAEIDELYDSQSRAGDPMLVFEQITPVDWKVRLHHEHAVGMPPDEFKRFLRLRLQLPHRLTRPAQKRQPRRFLPHLAAERRPGQPTWYRERASSTNSAWTARARWPRAACASCLRIESRRTSASVPVSTSLIPARPTAKSSRSTDRCYCCGIRG